MLRGPEDLGGIAGTLPSRPVAGFTCISAEPLLVDGQQIKCPHAVLGSRAGVAPGGLETGVPEELGDDDEVGATAHEGRCEGVPGPGAG